jgi:pimeloyl-ACP methyl ester carboxylesterase
MAGKYVDEVVRVLPAGPLIIGGYCFGAVIALEMAHQLREQGREMRLLVIIDPENLANGPGWTWAPQRQTRKEFLFWLIRGGPGLWRRYAIAVFNRRFRKRTITEEQRKQREMTLSHFRMSREYRARAYPGPAQVFHHEQANETLKERWAAILGESAGTVTIPGTKHHEVLHQGGKLVADLIREKTGRGEGG